MKLKIIWIGKTRERFIKDGIEKYGRYLSRYIDLEFKELKEEKIGDLREAPFIRRKEAEKVVRAIPPGSLVVALDERGQELTSYEFAEFLNKTLESGVHDLVFIIGGAMGLDDQVTARAEKRLALSRWTLTHEMARVVLLEQLYRAFTIITGKTYHY